MNIRYSTNAGEAAQDTRRIAEMNGLRLGLQAGALHLAGKMGQYPPQSSRPQPAKTAKQRAYLMWAIREGEIVIPYPRGMAGKSEKLGQSWTTALESNTRAVAGTAASYAELVQGQKQTEYHKITGWLRADTNLRNEAAHVHGIVHSYIAADIRR